MRVMLKFSFPASSGNELFRSGRVQGLLQNVMEDLKPEAAYFYSVDGHRGGHLIVNLSESSDLVRTAEPFWLALQAQVEMIPVMAAEDIQKGLPELPGIVQRYG